MTRTLTLATAVAALFVATPALAAPASTQVNANGSGKTVILSPLNFVKDTDLNFGSVVLPVGNAGTITVNPDPTATSFVTSTGVTQLPNSNPTRGLFVGAGSAGVPVVVQTTFPSQLYLGGNPAAASLPLSLKLDHAPVAGNVYSYTIDPGQAFMVYVGGTVGLPVGTADGAYSNTYTVTATYP